MLNTPEERHAFAIGFFEVLCPWRPHCWLGPNNYPSIQSEYHYYVAGRGLGFIALAALVCLAIKWLLCPLGTG